MLERNPALAHHLTHTMRAVADRAVVRMQPEVKRTICKRCSALLYPGISSTVRIRKGSESRVVVRCKRCGAVRRYPLARSRRKGGRLASKSPRKDTAMEVITWLKARKGKLPGSRDKLEKLLVNSRGMSKPHARKIIDQMISRGMLSAPAGSPLVISTTGRASRGERSAGKLLKGLG
eukprot:PLAT10571.1.p1 GENE.PLAT10571.1~~PLAT10571.1.p1  ORF type:complete len:199 (+),score=9.70 PLAT10571.1:68-598(+)